MNRRHFLALSIASSISIAARADEKKLRVGVIGHTGRGNYGHGLDTMWKDEAMLSARKWRRFMDSVFRCRISERRRG